MIKYLRILFFTYNICKARNQKKYNNSKTSDFRYQYNNLKQYYYILIYQNYCRIYIAIINLKNKSYHYFFSKHFSIQVNYFYSKHYLLSISVHYFLKNSFFYYKMFIINSTIIINQNPNQRNISKNNFRTSISFMTINMLLF